MRIFLRDMWRKCGKGLNIFSHWEELCSLDAYVWKPFVMLSIGALLVLLGDFAGLWARVAHQLSFILPGRFLASDVVWMLYILLPVVPIVTLSQEMFMARSRSSKANDAWWVYLYRYTKAMMVLLVSSLTLVATGVGAWPYVLSNVTTLLHAPKTAKTLSLIATFSGLGVLVAGVLLACLISVFVSLTYGLAFMMQGKSILESMKKGYKLLRAHWMYTGALMLLQFAVTTSLEWAGAYLYEKCRYAIVFHSVHFAMAAVFLVYWALLFSYHKRISKVPTTR